jgi:hypothetical protein
MVCDQRTKRRDPMTLRDIENDIALQRVLWAAFNYWNNEELPAGERAICYNWVLGPHKERFHTTFHHSRLLQLEKLGLLQKAELSRGGGRRYYRIIDAKRIESLLRAWRLT